MTGLRWPIQPLLDAGITPQQLRHQLGGRGYAQALHHGLTDRQADHTAIRHHYHPIEIWGWDWITAALTHLDHLHLTGGWRPAWLYQEEQRELGEAA